MIGKAHQAAFAQRVEAHDGHAAFARVLQLAGYPATPGPSLDQLVAVLDGVSSGPKGTPSATTSELVVLQAPSYEAREPRPSFGSCRPRQ